MINVLNEIKKTHSTILRASEVFTILSGFAFKSELFNSNFNGVPIIRIRDVGEKKSTTYYSGEYEKLFIVRSGDLLIGMDGDFRLAEWQGPDSLLNQRVCKIIPNESKVIPQYLKYFLPMKLKRIEDATSFVTVKHLSVKDISEITIPLPPLPEQKRIVELLDRAQVLIDKRKEQLGLMDSLVQSIFYEMFGDPVRNEKGWEIKKLGTVLSFISRGKAPDYDENGNGIAVKSAQVYPQGILWENCPSISDIAIEKYSEKYALQQGDILVNGTGTGTLGRPAIVKEIISKCAIPDGHVNILRLKKKEITPYYLFHLLLSDFGQSNISMAFTGSTNQIELYPQRIADFLIPLPPLSLQQEFADRVEKIEALKDRMMASLNELEQNFNALMQEAFGE